MSLFLRKIIWVMLIGLTMVATTTQAADYKLPFFRAEKEGQIIYVLGTMHAGKKDNYPLRAPIAKALEDADFIYLEISPEEMNNSASLMMQSLCKETCERNLTPAQQQLLNERLGTMAPMAANMPNWFVVILLSVKSLTDAGFDVNYATENLIITHAGDINKSAQIGGLESVQQQLDTLVSIDNAIWSTLLIESVQTPLPEQTKVMERLYQVWLAGDLDPLQQVVRSEITDSQLTPVQQQEYLDKLITQRNITMTQQAVKHLTDRKVIFIAVGAAHLVGDQGVIKLLEKQGFTTRQL